MLKKIGIPAVALFGLMALASPPKASAAVRFGIAIGGPVYRAPAPVYRYADPYYAAPYDYGYAAPVYAPAPVLSFGFGSGYGYGYRNYDRDRYYNRGFRGNEFRGRGFEHRR